MQDPGRPKGPGDHGLAARPGPNPAAMNRIVHGLTAATPGSRRRAGSARPSPGGRSPRARRPGAACPARPGPPAGRRTRRPAGGQRHRHSGDGQHRRSQRQGTRNCCMSDSSRNHSDTNPAVGGRPARVRLPRPARSRSTAAAGRCRAGHPGCPAPGGRHLRAGGEQQRLGDRVRDDLQRRREQPDGQQPTVVQGRADQSHAEPGQDQPGVLHAGVGDNPLQPGLHRGLGDTEHGGQPGQHQEHPGDPGRRRAEQRQGPPQAVEAHVDRDPGHDRAGRARWPRRSRGAARPGTAPDRP